MTITGIPLYPALAFVLVLLVGVVLMLACRGADIARERQDRRYARLEIQSDLRNRQIRVDRKRWEDAMYQAQKEQAERHKKKRQALYNWQREFSELQSELGK